MPALPLLAQDIDRSINPKLSNINAPINVKPLGGGRGTGGRFDVTSLPVVGTFDHSLSSFDQR